MVWLTRNHTNLNKTSCDNLHQQDLYKYLLLASTLVLIPGSRILQLPLQLRLRKGITPRKLVTLRQPAILRRPLILRMLILHRLIMLHKSNMHRRASLTKHLHHVHHKLVLWLHLIQTTNHSKLQQYRKETILSALEHLLRRRSMFSRSTATCKSSITVLTWSTGALTEMVVDL